MQCTSFQQMQFNYMDYLLLVACVHATSVHSKGLCEKTKSPLEKGVWRYNLNHMDSAVVESKPVSMSEGQHHVYENSFPGFTIKYIYVDNLAARTCGASATIKSGGVGTSTVLIILHADTNQEIRSVVDIWGVKSPERSTIRPVHPTELKNMKSKYLLKDKRPKKVKYTNKDPSMDDFWGTDMSTVQPSEELKSLKSKYILS